MQTVILLSGGLDSATTLATRALLSNNVTALHVRYGQRHSRETDAARAVAAHFEVPLKIVDVPIAQLAQHSALTNTNIAVPLDGEDADDVPITYVPMRNTVLLALAAAHLESLALAADPTPALCVIAVGANENDYSGYPDCRPEFYEAMEGVLARGSKLWSAGKCKLLIRTPIIKLTKTQIVREALRLGVPVDQTWSCYVGGDEPCRRCDACVLRDKALEEALR